jgi:hypothetical protein
MLGPGVMITSIPVGLIYGSRAIRRAPDRGFAWSGFVLALGAMAFMIVVLILSR